MHTQDIAPILTQLFSELTEGLAPGAPGFMLNPVDPGLLRSLDNLDAADASQSSHDGATIAAHAEHVRYGLSLMNRWAREGGNPFANATWGEAWKLSRVDEAKWAEIRHGLREEIGQWRRMLETPRDVNRIEMTGMIASIAHLAYHLGAIRQIARQTRGPKDGSQP